jgi:hypothetical protein
VLLCRKQKHHGVTENTEEKRVGRTAAITKNCDKEVDAKDEVDGKRYWLKSFSPSSREIVFCLAVELMVRRTLFEEHCRVKFKFSA